MKSAVSNHVQRLEDRHGIFAAWFCLALLIIVSSLALLFLVLGATHTYYLAGIDEPGNNSPVEAPLSSSSTGGGGSGDPHPPPQTPGDLFQVGNFSLPYAPACWVSVPGTEWVYLCNNATIDLWYVDPPAWTLQASVAAEAQALFVSSDHSLLWVVSNLTFVQYAAIDAGTGHLSALSNDTAVTASFASFPAIVDDGALGVWLFSTASGSSVIEQFSAWAPPHSGPGQQLASSTSTAFLDAGFFGNQSFYALVQQPAAVASYPIVSPTLNASAAVTSALPSLQTLSVQSRMFVDVNRSALVVGSGVGAVSIQLLGAGQPTQTANASLATLAGGQCRPAYDAVRGYLYNAINNTIYEYAYGAAPLQVAAFTVIQPAIAAPTLCALVEVGPDDNRGIALLSADRETVILYQAY